MKIRAISPSQQAWNERSHLHRRARAIEFQRQIQIEKIPRAEVAKAAGISESRLSQILKCLQ